MKEFASLIETIFRTVVNDKILVILSVTAIAILSIFKLPDKADTIIAAAFSGLFGVAVGVGIGRRIGEIQANGKPTDEKGGGPP